MHRSTSGHDIFEILVREHADMLVAYLRSLVSDTASVDDLFQETMLTAWRRLDDYDRSRPFGPWLRGIARNLSLAHFRQRSTLPAWCTISVLESIEASFDALQRSPGDSFRDRVDSLLTCIQRLSERLRVVIEMIYGRQLALAHIAEALGENEEAIKKRAQRARHLLHDCMLQSDSTS
ncbi:MAG: sigma-70 family RNA polymerase sigma factor [Planctomycetota bacterium]